MPEDRVAQLEHQLLTVQRRLEEAETRAIRAEKEAQVARAAGITLDNPTPLPAGQRG